MLRIKKISWRRRRRRRKRKGAGGVRKVGGD